jgi:hypothetical protein
LPDHSFLTSESAKEDSSLTAPELKDFRGPVTQNDVADFHGVALEQDANPDTTLSNVFGVVNRSDGAFPLDAVDGGQQVIYYVFELPLALDDGAHAF